jgi:hypothetical protein
LTHRRFTFSRPKAARSPVPGAPDSVHDYWKDVKWLQFSSFKESNELVTIPAEQVNSGTD